MSKQQTITDFVEANHKLLTTLGVFTALTVFSASLPVKALGYTISFLFFVATLMIWWELWSKFPQGGTGLLFWFENALNLVQVLLLVYLLVAYRSIWRSVLVFPIFGLLMALTVALLRRMGLLSLMFPSNPVSTPKLPRIAFGLLLTAIVIVPSILLASFIALPVNNWLDWLASELANLVP